MCVCACVCARARVCTRGACVFGRACVRVAVCMPQCARVCGDLLCEGRAYEGGEGRGDPLGRGGRPAGRSWHQAECGGAAGRGGGRQRPCGRRCSGLACGPRGGGRCWLLARALAALGRSPGPHPAPTPTPHHPNPPPQPTPLEARLCKGVCLGPRLQQRLCQLRLAMHGGPMQRGAAGVGVGHVRVGAVVQQVKDLTNRKNRGGNPGQ